MEVGSSHGRMSAHCFSCTCNKGKAQTKPNLRNRKSLNCQDMIGSTQEIEVEEVETVETVETTGESWD
jgi:hypothetical protein